MSASLCYQSTQCWPEEQMNEVAEENMNAPTLSVQFSKVQFSCSVMSSSLRPHESQHARPPCPSPTPGVHSDARPSSPCCHPAILSWVVPFSSCPQSLPASESFPAPQFKSINSSALSLLHSPTLTSIHDHRKNHSLD